MRTMSYSKFLPLWHSRLANGWSDPNEGRFRGWLLGIARNIAINTLTRRPHGAIGTGGGESQQSLAEVPAPTGPLSSQFDLEYRREVYRWAAEQVRESVATNTWNAFHLTHVEGVSIAEAATQLGVDIGNVYIARSRVMSRTARTHQTV